jgi:hypothetical protein
MRPVTGASRSREQCWLAFPDGIRIEGEPNHVVVRLQIASQIAESSDLRRKNKRLRLAVERVVVGLPSVEEGHQLVVIDRFAKALELHLAQCLADPLCCSGFARAQEDAFSEVLPIDHTCSFGRWLGGPSPRTMPIYSTPRYEREATKQASKKEIRKARRILDRDPLARGAE